MKKSLFTVKAILATTLLTCSVGALANNAPLKVAVIKDAAQSDNIIKGKFVDSITSLSKKKLDALTFEESTSLCVAYLRTKDSIKSEMACTAAVDSSKTIASKSNKALYLKSISYSNRGVSRYLSGDIPAAMDDLTTAILIDKNAITESNLASIKITYADTMVDEFISKAD